MFHPLRKEQYEGVELPKLFTNPFDYEPHPIVELARKELCKYLDSEKQWHAEIELGKMFGVLVVENSEGQIGFLAAFSGYLDKKTRHEYFVPPIVDLLEEGGFFAVEEANISQINREIEELKNNASIAKAESDLQKVIESEKAEIETLKREYKESRERRRELRAECCDPETLTKLEAESQQQKGAIKRRELHFRMLREPLEQLLQDLQSKLKSLQQERQQRSAALQKLTFSNFQPLNALGKSENLINIFENYNRSTPPAGSGECAAPKLLHYAYQSSLRPIAMGEFWRGNSTRGEVRRDMHYYPACRGKCHPILGYMLQGLQVDEPRKRTAEETFVEQLEVVFEDEYMVVFNKPSGLPSVRGLNHTISVQSIAEERYPEVNPNNLVVHRLDMDTSGIIIFAKSAEVQTSLQQQFASHTIRKRYIALLDGHIMEKNGAIDLPLALDPTDRPRQRVDYEYGKPAYTHYSLMSYEGDFSRVALYPQTGRTHQLRVHCAHAKGLNTPIVGDRLYGKQSNRLMLHAEHITLLHPHTQRKFTLRCAPSF